MDADFTAGPGDSRSARQPGYRLTHPDTASPGTSPNPVLTGIDTGGHAGPGRNGHEAQSVQWSTAPVTLRTAPESDGLPRRLAPDLPQRTAEPEAVAARLAAEGEPFSARITTDAESFAAPAVEESFAAHSVTNGSLYDRSATESPATNGSHYTARPEAREDIFGASPALDMEAPVARRYAPEPEPPARLENPARLESMEAVAASLREAEEAQRETVAPAKAPSRRRAAPEPAVEQPVSVPAETRIETGTESKAEAGAESRAAEFRTSDATIDLHHIMRLLTASHDLDEAVRAAESGKITVAELAQVARRNRAAAVELVAAWYGGADHMRKFGEVLLQAAAETSPAPPRSAASPGH